jgi:hypothetical protein
LEEHAEKIGMDDKQIREAFHTLKEIYVVFNM